MTSLQTTGYQEWLLDLKDKIRAAQTRAVAAANRELVLLYWHIGRENLDRQQARGWGAKVVDQLAVDLRKDFPHMRGFSARNLKYVRAFAQAWPDLEIVQTLSAQISWSHHCSLLDKVKDAPERLWYAKAASSNGWSLAVLHHHIETRAHARQGAAITNPDKTLPAPQSDLAQQLFKDPYILDFMTLAEDAAERDDPTIGLILCKT